MFLRYLSVKNFRALRDVEAEFDKPINVIVGPNASGKTTILEAIRLAKALLAPRTPNESNQSLMAIGATSPHMPQRLIPEAIAQDQSLPTEIRTHYLLNDEEIAQIDGSIPQIATNMALSRLGQQFPNQAAVIGFLSSDDGKQAVKTVEQEIRVGLGKMRISHECRLDLTIDYATGRMAGSDPLGQAVFAFLEQRCPPSVTVFSYFPADRALPTGEPAIHFGGADVGNQLESHNSQPQLKYFSAAAKIFSIEKCDLQRRHLKSGWQGYDK